MGQEINREEILALLEEDYRTAFDENLVKMKASLMREDATEESQQNEPPIVPVLLVYLDRERMLPLVIIEYEFLGTRDEIRRVVEAHHKRMVESAEFRKQQNRLFVSLKTKYHMKDRDILDLLIPNVSKDERDKVYNRLKRHLARIKASRRGTKP